MQAPHVLNAFYVPVCSICLFKDSWIAIGLTGAIRAFIISVNFHFYFSSFNLMSSRVNGDVLILSVCPLLYKSGK